MGKFAIFAFQARAMDKELAQYPIGHLGICAERRKKRVEEWRRKRELYVKKLNLYGFQLLRTKQTPTFLR
jgi:hypothetical protein